MNFLPSPIPFRHGLANDTPAHRDDGSIGVEPDHEAVSGAESAEAPDADAVQDTAAAPTPWHLFGFAALSGAVAAAVVVFVVSVFPLRSSQDPRTPQLIHDLTALTTRVQTLSDQTRTVETEDVATGQTISAIDRRLTSAADELNAVSMALSALTAEQRHREDAMAGVNAPALFGVAVVQLRDRIEAGLPFDWELVDLRGIVGGDKTLLAELDRLAPMAASGVVTEQRLNEAMRILLDRYGPRSSLVQAGLSVVDKVLGPNLVGTPTAESQLLVLSAARLSAGDLANFVRLMEGLSGPTAAAARPVVTAARQRMIGLAAVQTLLGAARSSLQSQLRLVSAASVAKSRP